MQERHFRSFASDNNSGACPEVMEALARANVGHAVGYGDDPWTKSVEDLFRQEFGPFATPFLVFNGTGANVLALSLATPSGCAILCAEGAHAAVDEAGAPEAAIGAKVLPLASSEGKVLPHALEEALGTLGSVHQSQPACLSLSQPTELGTLYTMGELRSLSEIAHRAGLRVHLDGARIANAAVALGLPLGAFGAEAGVDILSFGGTKNGIAFGEAMIVLAPDLAKRAPFLRKTRLQLASKMRFIAAQYEVYLRDGLWKRNAAAANAAGAKLGAVVAKLPGLELAHRVETNAVFARIPRKVRDDLARKWFFYDWEGGLVRWMASFDTDSADLDEFVDDLSKALTAAGPR